MNSTLVRPTLTEDALLARAAAAGRVVGSVLFAPTKPKKDVPSDVLRAIAQKALRSENIGVKRQGTSFVVEDDCIEYFLHGLQEAAVSLRIAPARANQDRPRISFNGDERILISRAGLSAEIQQTTTLMGKARLIERASQIVIEAENRAIDSETMNNTNSRRRARARARLLREQMTLAL